MKTPALLAACVWLLLGCPALANNHQLIYDPTDGSLTIDPLGSTIAYYCIRGDVPLDDLKHRRFLGGTLAAVPGQVCESNPFAPQQGIRNLGEVLPAGLSEQEYLTRFTQADYVAFFGEPVLDFDLVYLPEPGTLAAFALGFAVLSRRRR